MNRVNFQSACAALWGPQYRSEAARQLALGLRTVMRYDSGERTIPHEVSDMLAKLLVDRQERIALILRKINTNPAN